MARFPATIQIRTTFEQAGRLAGVAGDLGISEAEVARRVLDWGLESPQLGRKLRAEIAREGVARARSLDRAKREGRVPADVRLEHLVVGDDAA